MKTALLWFEELPEPYRSQAIENARRQGERDSYNYLMRKHESLHQCIGSCFVWDYTEQGHKYWENVRNGIFTSDKPKSLKGFGTFDKRFIKWSKMA